MALEYEMIVQDRNATPFVINRLGYTMYERLRKHTENPPDSVCHFTDNKLKWYSHVLKWEKYGESVAQKVIELPDDFKSFNINYRKAISELRSFSKKIFNSSLEGLSKEKLWQTYLEGSEKYEEVYEYGIISTMSDLGKAFLSTGLTNALKSYTNDVNVAFVSLTTPDEPSAILVEEMELMKLALDGTITKESEKVKRHHEEFFWLTFGYEGPIYSINDIWAKILELQKQENLKEELESKKNSLENIKTERKAMIKELSLDLKICKSFEVARVWLLLKEARKASFFSCYAAFDKLAMQISKQLQAPKNNVKFLTKKELEAALFQNEFPSNLTERKKNSIYLYNGKDEVLVGKAAEEFVKLNVRQSVKEKDELIKGQVAFPGLVTGVVKLISEPSDMVKMNEGDVLVSPATNPNILPAMKKAVAFVTDVGGITCHAAIVAREMKKPCVIGTKNATSILKDGDKVEVDANQGIVRKIK